VLRKVRLWVLIMKIVSFNSSFLVFYRKGFLINQVPYEKKFVRNIFLPMNNPKMPYCTELIFADDGFKRDFSGINFCGC